MIIFFMLNRKLRTIGDKDRKIAETSVLDSAIKRETSLPGFELDKVLNQVLPKVINDLI